MRKFILDLYEWETYSTEARFMGVLGMGWILGFLAGLDFPMDFPL